MLKPRKRALKKIILPKKPAVNHDESNSEQENTQRKLPRLEVLPRIKEDGLSMKTFQNRKPQLAPMVIQIKGSGFILHLDWANAYAKSGSMRKNNQARNA